MSNRPLDTEQSIDRNALRVFDMNLKDIRYHNNCFVCDNNRLRKQSENPHPYHPKNRTIERKPDEQRRSCEANSNRKQKFWVNARKAGRIKRTMFWEEAQERIKKSISVVALSRTKEVLHSNRYVGKQNVFNADFQKTRRGNPAGDLIKARNNQSLAYFGKISSKPSGYNSTVR